VSDAGSFSIPAALATELYKLGMSGFPTITITRRTADSTTITPGCIQFSVSSSLELEVSIVGLVSCIKDTECPTGQVCKVDLTCG